ncbi:hypothetical protein OEZ86_002321 [Tetradesmus obliquus]|nr:hypothetical protein OEZ86_002321 [Tetradesmus obliquus]
MIANNPTSANLKIVASYNMRDNIIEPASSVANINYCLATQGASQCDPNMWCQGGFNSLGAVTGSLECSPYPQYNYPPCGMKLRGQRKNANVYNVDAIRAGGFSVNIDLVTSDMRSCVARRRVARKLAQMDTKPNDTTITTTTTIEPVMMKPLLLTQPQDTIIHNEPVTVQPLLATGQDSPGKPVEPMEGSTGPIKPVAMEGPTGPVIPGDTGIPNPGEPVTVINTGFVKPDLPPGDTNTGFVKPDPPPVEGEIKTTDVTVINTGFVKPELPPGDVKSPDVGGEPIDMTGAPKPVDPIDPNGNNGWVKPPPIYTMTGGPIAMPTPPILGGVLPPPVDMLEDEDPDFEDPPMVLDTPPLLTDRPSDPQPNWRGDSTGSGSGKNAVVYGGSCTVRLSMYTPGTPSLFCLCFKGTAYAKINSKAQKVFTVGGPTAFNRWKCKDVMPDPDCMPYSCVL